jgi:NAD(P)-dependent dehydrogenase (short-subunit alcohol dehydrogenase family)
MATEWGPYNVRVVGLVPGYIKGTEGFERLGDFNNLNNRAGTDNAFHK